MKEEAVERLPKMLSNANLAALTKEYAGSGAYWYLSPALEIGLASEQLKKPAGTGPLIRAQFIIEKDGVVVGQWAVNPVSYGSIVLRHYKEEGELYVIPHLAGYEYDDYQQLQHLKEIGLDLKYEIASELNVLMRVRYTLDDTVGLDRQEAESWWVKAERIEQELPYTTLCYFQENVGSPSFKFHSSQLADVIKRSQKGLEALQRFLAEVPIPEVCLEPSSKQITDGNGSRYKNRHWYKGDFLGGTGIVECHTYPYNLEQTGLVNGKVITWPIQSDPFTAPFDTSGSFDFHEEGPDDSTSTDNLSNENKSVREQLLHIRRLVDQVLDQLEHDE